MTDRDREAESQGNRKQLSPAQARKQAAAPSILTGKVGVPGAASHQTRFLWPFVLCGLAAGGAGGTEQALR